MSTTRTKNSAFPYYGQKNPAAGSRPGVRCKFFKTFQFCCTMYNISKSVLYFHYILDSKQRDDPDEAPIDFSLGEISFFVYYFIFQF